MKVLMVVASNNFRDEEYLEPRHVLESFGAKVTVASSTGRESRGIGGARVLADIALKEARAEDYEAIIFVGGSGAKEYFEDEVAMDLAKASLKAGKITAAICIAPVILANAGLLQGKRATVFGSMKGDLLSKGAILIDENVVVDGRIITANGPAAANRFGLSIAERLS
ncbi:MAG: DJ-1/PfpI family protein [Actinomycetota bacterium]|nr:DJ-1/PfpI family protein [Actinomycetota bacterium]